MRNKLLGTTVAVAMAWSMPALAGPCADELDKVYAGWQDDTAYYRTVNTGKRAKFYRRLAEAARELDAKNDQEACMVIVERIKRNAAADVAAYKKVDVTAYEKQRMDRIGKGKTLSEFRGGLVRARDVQDNVVISTDAKTLGTVDDVWVVDGQYYFVVAKEGAFASEAKTRYVVPASAIRVTDDDEVIIGVTQKDFANAPVFREDDGNISRETWKAWQRTNQKFYNGVSTFR